MRTVLLVLGHIWILPWTLVGLFCAAVGKTTFYQINREWFALHFVAKPDGLASNCLGDKYAAVTIGSVVVFKTIKHADIAYLNCHEHRHVQQQMWFGPLAPIFYAVGWLIGLVTGKGAYWGNPLEVDARQSCGDTREEP